MNETIVEVLIMIAASIGCLLFAALSAWKAAYDKRTWSLVKGRYVRMPIWNYMSFVALFSAMPIILLLDGCDMGNYGRGTYNIDSVMWFVWQTRGIARE